MSKVTVLGAGNIGSFIGKWLAENTEHKVQISDVSKDTLDAISCDKLEKFRYDLSLEADIADLIKDSDLVINALPSFLGFNALKTAINAGKHVVDISYMTEDPRQLQELAKEKGVTALLDFGFAPGMCHMFVGRALKKLGHLTKSIIYVGGLPQKEEDDYKVVFSARDVLEEYSRPARVIKEGEVVSLTPFEHNFVYEDTLPNGRRLGVSGFISDGLRSLLTLKDKVDNMVESTLRYNQHFTNMVALKDNGFFTPEHIEYTAKVLADKWKRGPEDRDMSVLHVSSENKDGMIDHIFYDEFDQRTGVHSMARVTGFPVIIGTLLILSGELNKPGINLPEEVAQDDKIFDRVVSFLKEQGIRIEEKDLREVKNEFK